MPTISRFLGILIQMYANDHYPPHFYAVYAGFDGVFDIESCEMIKGNLPPKQVRRVTVWAELHQEDLRTNWALTRKNQELLQIEPLK